jgi:serine protease Do
MIRARYTGRLLVALALAAAAGLASAPPAPAQGKGDPKEILRSSPKMIAAFRDVVASARDSTVRVLCDDKEVAYGTVVAPDGWVLTKASELTGKPVVKFTDGVKLEAKVVGVQEAFDLAMLKVEAKGLKPVQWRDSKLAPVGHFVATVGLAEDPVAVGVVSVAARKSPVVRTGGGYLGVGLTLDPDGVRIAEVVPGTAADKAGLKADDLVLSLAGKAIDDVDVFSETVQRYKPGEVVTLRVRRSGEEKELKATLGARPSEEPAKPGAPTRPGGRLMTGELSRKRTGFPLFLQHDTILKPAECGGPLVDLDGKTIGVNIARADRVESYAIPTEAILPLLGDLKSGKLAPKPPEEKKPEKKPEK